MTRHPADQVIIRTLKMSVLSFSYWFWIISAAMSVLAIDHPNVPLVSYVAIVVYVVIASMLAWISLLFLLPEGQ